MEFRYFQNDYRKDHLRYPNDPNQACHKVPVMLLEHYGVSGKSYRQWADVNYRMGDVAINGRDKSVDYQIRNEIFQKNNGQNYGNGCYNSAYLRSLDINNDQQLQRIGTRFDSCKEAYNRTGQNIYLTMQKDLRYIAGEYLNADLRGFKISKKH